MSNHLQTLASAAPESAATTSVDWVAFDEGLRLTGVDSRAVVAASWCSFGLANIEANIDGPALAVIHPGGVYASVGKRKMLESSVKYSTISFDQVRTFGPAETTDPRGVGKYCIEFAGAGSILLGRLQWAWRAKRFRDSRATIMASAEERDRILSVVDKYLG